MFKDVLNHINGAADFASIGLIIFFIVFLAITVQAACRSRRDISAWSRLPLNDGTEPQHRRESEANHEQR